MEQASNDNKALVALMDLVLAIADYVTTPPGHRSKAVDRVRAERREVGGWRETLHLMGTEANRGRLEAAVKQKAAREMDEAFYGRLERATGRPGILLASSDGLEAKAAVEATGRRYDRMWMRGMTIERNRQGELDPIEADDSRVTDGHQCCGGKPDCGCRSVGG